jgi:hypothetical protein
MSQILIRFLVITAALCVAGRAGAETSRYSMTPVEGGALRLDTQSGAVSLCKENNGQLVCASVADETVKMRSRLEALEAENSALKADLANLQAAAAKAVAPGKEIEQPSGPRESGKLKPPSDHEIDQMMAFVEKMARRLKSMVQDLQREQSPPPAGEQL